MLRQTRRRLCPCSNSRSPMDGHRVVLFRTQGLQQADAAAVQGRMVRRRIRWYIIRFEQTSQRHWPGHFPRRADKPTERWWVQSTDLLDWRSRSRYQWLVEAGETTSLRRRIHCDVAAYTGACATSCRWTSTPRRCTNRNTRADRTVTATD